ncbi:uncharacterized protein LOC100116956 [Nasonia vitripennis]|uniref:Carboxylesterase type B domain-containing protein n=1 Tax=Nasonia vitripennis TaxID=7425 RepID=A0A7M7R0Q8_NASVI|nr:uncharacterized protein LOC100116956 [Nasonia vitripennis]
MSIGLKCASLLLLLAAVAGSYATEPEVRTSLGRVRGSFMNTRLNKTIYAFRGVRYGKSTEGERRFKQAEPVEAWTGVFDASKEGPSCPLPAVPELASEDCLRLNVYTTKLPDSRNKVNRPVIVFFHPGGFYGFSAQSYVFGPQYYLDQDIVLVTVNYRLATFGFMSTGDARAPGNLGLKDQVVALRWVQKNIAAFGGDPNSVTITGYSAGSWSVVLHLMSPMSKGLFHRAIAMSGSPTTPDLMPTKQPELILKQAKFVDCPYDNVDVALECLKKVPHQKISDSMEMFREWYGDPTLIWSPVVEPEVPGVERFITAQPVDLLRTKNFQHVPLITGITKDEFAGAPLVALEAALKGDDSIYRNTSANWEHAAPISFQYERDTERSKHISREIRKFYFNDQTISTKNGRNLGLIYADALIGYPNHRFADLVASNSRAPVWNYMFVYPGRFSFSVWSDTQKPYGVVHHDDLQYIFYMSFIFPFFNSTDPETKLVEKMTAMWANFAKTGEPIPKHNELFKGVTWPLLKPKTNNYLEIGETFTVKSNMYPDRYALWDRLFPLPPVSCTQLIHSVLAATSSRACRRLSAREIRKTMAGKVELPSLLLLLCLVTVIAALGVKAEDEPSDEALEVQAPLGKLKGAFMETRLGKKILAYRGVRYAEPPTGQQRFQPPIPAKPWDNVFDASEEGPACPQGYAENQSEDCLRLNVYTTKLSSAGEIVKRPVIVYFHPGGYYSSSAQSLIDGPQFLLDHEIVLVTVNYRLSSLGFMSTGDSLLPGNLGLKDQVEALRWVKKNIAAFGGDANCVTITGYSAGSWSVSLHLVSPMSKGLFHRAIASSGSAVYQEQLPSNQSHLAKKQAELLGCPTDTVGNMLVCLNTKSAEDFASSVGEFFEWHNNPILQWLPVVEPEVRGVERFLPAQPIDLIRQGKFHKVPLITGVSKDEFGGRIVPMIEQARSGNNSMFDDLNEEWDRLAPINFLYERGTNRSKEISRKLKEHYLHGKPVGVENSEGLARLFADGVIGYSVHRLVNLLAEASEQPVYYYKFTYQGPYSHVTWNDTKKPYGVVHHDDLLYLFRVSFFPDFDKDSPDLKTVERMTAIWSNFAKTGEPIPKDDRNFANVSWERYSAKEKKYLEIGSELVLKAGLNAERMELWDKLFPVPLLLPTE